MCRQSSVLGRAGRCGRSDATASQSEAYPFLMHEGVCVIGARLSGTPMIDEIR
jgi:hypothetical protein